MSTESASTRTRELDDSQDGRSPKRTKIDQSLTDTISPINDQELADVLPPSHVLLGIARPTRIPDGSMHRIVEADVGISEYVAPDVPKISGIIKQRCGGCLGSNIDAYWP
jgi:tRNA pseudouridine13 synthase